MPDDKYLDIQNLDAGYGRSQVLFDINMSVPWRGGVAVLGRNGAGKTTLMKAIIGELPLLGGSVSLDGRDVGRLPTEQRIRLGIRLRSAGAFGVRPAFGAGQSRGRGAVRIATVSAIDRVLEIFPKLGQRMDQTAGTLSGGERKMLAIGRALLGEPEASVAGRADRRRLDRRDRGNYRTADRCWRKRSPSSSSSSISISRCRLPVTPMCWIVARLRSRDRRRTFALIQNCCSISRLETVYRKPCPSLGRDGIA